MRSFMAYQSIIGRIHGLAHPNLQWAMVNYSLTIYNLVDVYRYSWYDQVLPLAMMTFSRALQRGVTEPSIWVISHADQHRYTSTPLPQQPTNQVNEKHGKDYSKGKIRDVPRGKSGEKSLFPCNAFNEAGCFRKEYRFTHKCTKCSSLDHGELICKRPVGYGWEQWSNKLVPSKSE